MAECRFGALYDVTDFHDTSAVRSRFNAYGRESEPEPDDVMGWAVDDITIGGGLESILEALVKYEIPIVRWSGPATETIICIVRYISTGEEYGSK